MRWMASPRRSEENRRKGTDRGRSLRRGWMLGVCALPVLGGAQALGLGPSEPVAPNPIDASGLHRATDRVDPEPTLEDWTADLDRLVREIRYRHPNPEHFGPLWEDFVADAHELRGRLGELPPWQIPWEFSRLVATLAEGHTWVEPWSLEGMGNLTALRFGFYEEGLFVVGSAEDHHRWMGARVTHIAGLDPMDLLARAREIRLTSADNEMSLRWWTARHLSMPSALAALGALEKPGPVEYRLETTDGEQHEVTLEALPPDPRRAISQYGRLDGSRRPPKGTPELYTYEVHADAKALYWRWDGFREADGRPWDAFCAEAFATFEREGLERLILDLRGNGGGNPDFGIPVLRGILRQPALDAPNALILLIGPSTDSAAVSFGVSLERLCDPVFVGMPTFLRPNGHSDAFTVALPRTGLAMHVATAYWRAGHPLDRRPWIAPHLAVPVRFEDVLSGKDRALTLALEGVEPPRIPTFRPTLRRGHAAEDLEQQLQDWRSDPQRRWFDVEDDINALGYRLMAADRLVDATEVFELNCRLHPYASNVYDSYGEALLKAGRERAALAAYRESVRRDHGNVAAIEIILDLEDRVAGR